MGDITTAEVAIPASATEPPAAPQNPDRPAWLPEKFKTVEELAQSYKELESKVGKPTDIEPPAVTPPVTPPVVETPDLSKVDLNPFTEEFQRDGKLSEASYEVLKGKGFDKTVVDNYIDGQRAAAQVVQANLFKDIGGEQGYGELINWAASNLTPAEQKAFNTAVANPDQSVVKFTIDSLAARRTANEGRAPKLVGGGSPANSGGPQPFLSQAQLTAALRDPRYATDPIYQNEVVARLAASSI